MKFERLRLLTDIQENFPCCIHIYQHECGNTMHAHVAENT